MSFNNSSSGQHHHFVAVSSPSDGGSSGSSGDSSDESSSSAHQRFTSNNTSNSTNGNGNNNKNDAYNQYMLNEICSRVVAASAALMAENGRIIHRPHASYAALHQSSQLVEVGSSSSGSVSSYESTGSFSSSSSSSAKSIPIQKRILNDYWPGHHEKQHQHQYNQSCHRTSNRSEEDVVFMFSAVAGGDERCYEGSMMARRQISFGSETTSKHFSGNQTQKFDSMPLKGCFIF
jgi:hypothetical protein